MPRNCPTASIKGQGEWEWNRLQAARKSDRSSTERTDRQRTRSRALSDCQERVRALEAEIRHLEAELERKDRELQSIIERYERLLAERNRKLASRTKSEESTENTISDLLSEFFEK